MSPLRSNLLFFCFQTIPPSARICHDFQAILWHIVYQQDRPSPIGSVDKNLALAVWVTEGSQAIIASLGFCQKPQPKTKWAGQDAMFFGTGIICFLNSLTEGIMCRLEKSVVNAFQDRQAFNSSDP